MNDKDKNLFEVADLQQGLFTAAQAKACGYPTSRLPYYVNTGKWIREGRGIYRLNHYPMGERPDLVYWSLWSCNRKGEVQGVFSHLTALAIHDLSDAMPSKYHMSVPKEFRKFHPIPANIVLYSANVKEDERIEGEGFLVTTPKKTIFDVMLCEKIAEEIAIQAIKDGLERHTISMKEVIDVLFQQDTKRAMTIRTSLGSL